MKEVLERLGKLGGRSFGGKIEFVVASDGGSTLDVMRFDPERSYALDADGKPADGPDGAAATSFAWGFVRIFSDRTERTLLDFGEDRDGLLPGTPDAIRRVAETGEPSYRRAFGWPQSDWRVERVADDDPDLGQVYEISVFCDDGVGFRFHAHRSRALAFADWLEAAERAVFGIGRKGRR